MADAFSLAFIRNIFKSVIRIDLNRADFIRIVFMTDNAMLIGGEQEE